MTPSTRIAVARSFGTPQAIALENHPSPELPNEHVRVAVRTAGLNPVDARRRAGTLGGRTPLVFGSEFAGVVVESAHPAWQAGDHVIGWSTQGAAADLVVADGGKLIAKPDDVNWELAGGLMGVGHTALTTLAALKLPSGSLVLIHGISGGVGTVLAQLAVARGLEVIGTTSPANHDYVRRLGASPVDYGPGLADRITVAATGRDIAASIDLAGTTEAGDVGVAITRTGGKAVTLVPETAGSHGLPLIQIRPSPAQARELVDAVATGALVMPVERIRFTDISEAHRRLDAKHARGKLVLDLSDNPHLTPITAGV